VRVLVLERPWSQSEYHYSIYDNCKDPHILASGLTANGSFARDYVVRTPVLPLRVLMPVSCPIQEAGSCCLEPRLHGQVRVGSSGAGGSFDSSKGYADVYAVCNRVILPDPSRAWSGWCSQTSPTQ